MAKVALRRALIRRGIIQGGGFWLAVVATLCLAGLTWMGATGTAELLELDSDDLFLLSIGWNVVIVCGYGLAAILLVVDLVGAVLWARESSFAYNHRFMQVSNGGLSRETVRFPAPENPVRLHEEQPVAASCGHRHAARHDGGWFRRHHDDAHRRLPCRRHGLARLAEARRQPVIPENMVKYRP